MKKLSDVIPALIEGNSLLQAGLAHRLLNLSAVAEFIQPLVSARLKRDVSKASVLMGLSRLQKKGGRFRRKRETFRIHSLSIRSDIASITYSCSQEIDALLPRLYAGAGRRHEFLIVNHGTSEITFLCAGDLAKRIRTLVRGKPKNYQDKLAGLSIRFDEKYVSNPGLLYFLIQQVTMQSINIHEISSTFTELVIYVKESDLNLAFETLYGQFGGRRSG